MNSDSFFDQPIIKENKGLITLFVTIGLAILSIYYLYRKVQTQETATNIAQNISQQVKVTKKRITLNAKNILFTDTKSIDVSAFYASLDKLSKSFDIYIIILIEENEDQNDIVDKLAELYKDDIIKKHVFFIINLAYIILKQARRCLCYD